MTAPESEAAGEQAGEPSMGQWARDIAATYREIAEATPWEPRRAANFAEAHKYEGIANRMDSILPTQERVL